MLAGGVHRGAESSMDISGMVYEALWNGRGLTSRS